MKIKLTPESVLKFAEEGVAERGEGFVYEAEDGECKYVHGVVDECDDDGRWGAVADQPNLSVGCFVGYILDRAGVNMNTIVQLGLNDNTGSTEIVNALTNVDIIEDPADDVYSFLSVLQSNQDEGIPWGEALKNAKSMLDSE